MVIFSLIYIHTFLFLFIGYAKSDLGSKHHLGALHEIVDGVLENRLRTLWINKVKINFIVGCYLKSHVSLDVKQLAFEGELGILGPIHFPSILILFQFE